MGLSVPPRGTFEAHRPARFFRAARRGCPRCWTFTAADGYAGFGGLNQPYGRKVDDGPGGSVAPSIFTATCLAAGSKRHIRTRRYSWRYWSLAAASAHTSTHRQQQQTAAQRLATERRAACRIITQHNHRQEQRGRHDQAWARRRCLPAGHRNKQCRHGRHIAPHRYPPEQPRQFRSDNGQIIFTARPVNNKPDYSVPVLAWTGLYRQALRN